MISIRQAAISVINGDWDGIGRDWPYKAGMESCIQDPVHHAEGDVWIHTKMVYDEVLKCDLGAGHRLAALYHDVAKPQTRIEVIGKDRIHVSHPGHSRLGAQMLWKDLWQHGVGEIEDRIRGYWLSRWHQRVFHLWTQDDMARAALICQADVDLQELIAFARCDTQGRICSNGPETLADLDLLGEWATEAQLNDLLQDGDSRLFFFEKSGRSEHYHAMPPTGSRAVIMCGLPGSGKDTLIRSRYGDHGIVSLDGIREELDVPHGENQGVVIQAAMEKARTFLRERKPVVWNATNLTKQMRSKIIGLMRDYDAHVTIAVMSTPFEECLRRNSLRADPVPEQAISRMLGKWEPPSRIEAHEIEWI